MALMLPWFITDMNITVLSWLLDDNEAKFLAAYKMQLKDAAQHISLSFLDYFDLLIRLYGIVTKLLWALPWLEYLVGSDSIFYNNW